jgi:nicotinamide riboside transporter PnuC
MAKLFFGIMIAQALVTGIGVYIWQLKNSNIEYWQAVRLYYKKSKGRYVIVLLATIALMFMLTDWMNLNMTRAELLAKGALTRTEKIQLQFKTWALGIGSVIEVAAMLFYRGAIQAILNFGKSKGIDTNDLLNKN